MSFGVPTQINTSADPAATANTPNQLVTLANDGTALVAWFDGTNQQVSYAAAPYTSWTSAQIASFHRFAASMFINDAGGDVSAVACDNITGINYYPLTKSGASYSIGSSNYTGAGFSTYNPGSCQILLKDGQGRYWLISNDNTNGVLKVWYSSTPASGTWTQSLSISTASNTNMPCADIVGNYLVVLYPDTSSTVSYQRLDVSGGSLGSWSTSTRISVTGTPGSTSHFSFRGNGSGIGVFVYSFAAAGHTITAHTYTASNDTWSSAHDLSTSSNDDFPNVVNAGGDIYVFWCQYAATNSYALAWNVWRKASSTWDISAKQIVGSGTNISNPNGTYNATLQTIALMYTVGTGSPYSVEFVTLTTGKPVFAVPASMPIISRGVPAFTNDDFTGAYPASLANNSVYNDSWRCAQTPVSNANTGTLIAPVYVAYDLSSVPSTQRQNVLVAWYNDHVNGAAYDPTVIANNANNVPTNYTIDINSGAGGGSPPGSSWTTLVTVNNATPIHSMLHLVNMSGANWIRINITGIYGSAGNNNAQLNMDIHDAHNAVYASTSIAQDVFKAFGDSITAAAYIHSDTILPAQVNALASSHYPAIEDAGVGGWTSTDVYPKFAYWLSLFPGQFVIISLGTNDANLGGTYLPTFQGNIDAMVKMVLASGKIPIVPRMPWGGTTGLLANVPTLNSQIDSVVSSNPGCMAGPDLYAFFNAHQSEINSSDHIHPTSQGYLDYQNLWANWIVANIYTSGSDPDTFAFLHYQFGVQV